MDLPLLPAIAADDLPTNPTSHFYRHQTPTGTLTTVTKTFDYVTNVGN